MKGHNVFGAATRQLAAWLAETCPQAEVVLAAPVGERSELTLHAFLLDVRPRESHSDRRTAVVEALLRYAVAAGGATAEEAHDLLGEVFAAAALEAGVRVVGGAIAPELWIAHGTAPRPCLQIEIAARAERPIEHRWTVEHPLEVHLVDRDSVPADGGEPGAQRHGGDAPNGQSSTARG